MSKKSGKPRVGETSSVIKRELKAMLRQSAFEDRLRGNIEAQLRDKARNDKLRLSDEELRDIKSRYPDITREEVISLPQEEFNKCSIGLFEKIVKDYKDQLQSFFKNHKDWNMSEEDIEWYKDLLREGKNSAEVHLKEIVRDQRYLRGGLNPPFMYEHRKKK